MPVLLPGETHGQRSLVGYRHKVAKSQTWLKWLHMYACNSLVLGFIFTRYSSHWAAPHQSIYSLVDKTLPRGWKTATDVCRWHIISNVWIPLGCDGSSPAAREGGQGKPHDFASPAWKHTITFLTSNQYFHAHSGWWVTSKLARTWEH